MTGDSGRRLLSHSITSLLDQALLSALNLGLGLLVIRETDQESYGLFAQLMAAWLLAVVIAEATLTNPLTTLASGSEPGAQQRAISHVARLHLRVSLGVAAAFGVVALCVVLGRGVEDAWWIAATFALTVLTTMRRELQRAAGFIVGRPDGVLLTDTVYGVTLVGGLLVLLLGGWVSLPWVMVTLIAANLAPVLLRSDVPRWDSDGVAYATMCSATWSRGRLSLPGALASWLVNFSFLYVAGAMLGLAAAADLSASRLLLMPLSLCVVAWSRVARPMTTRLIVAGDESTAGRLRRLVVGSVVALTAVAAVYALLLWPALPWLETHLLGPGYEDLGPLVWLWAAYFTIYTWKFIGTTLLLGYDAYPALLRIALISLAVTVVVLPTMTMAAGSEGAVASLGMVEAVTLVLTVRACRREAARLAATAQTRESA